MISVHFPVTKITGEREVFLCFWSPSLLRGGFRERFQFWFFFYDTGNPIAYSAMLLRETLTKTLQSVDPEGVDPARKEMVVIGHSQGGLLAKMTAIDSGTKFWDIISSTPFDEAQMKPETRDLLRLALFVKPLPFVKRLVFIATPQRGSYVAGWRAIKWFTGLLIKPAAVVLSLTTDILFLRTQDAIAMDLQAGIPTSVDNMNPRNRFIQTLAAIPVAPGVAFNSIIAVRQDEDIGDDGVVKYRSAHLEDAESNRWFRQTTRARAILTSLRKSDESCFSMPRWNRNGNEDLSA